MSFAVILFSCAQRIEGRKLPDSGITSTAHQANVHHAVLSRVRTAHGRL